MKKSGTFRTGIDLGGTKIEGLVLSATGSEVWRKRIASPRGSYENTILAIRDLVLEAEVQLGEQTTVGVGIPGAVSPATGLVKNANSTWLIGNALQEDLSLVLDREVRLENDANCFTVSEAVDGAGKHASVVFGVILGTGVGGGISINRKPLKGRSAIAGEWGHNPLPWPRPGEYPACDCYCGNNGCIETFLSGPGFARCFFEDTGKTLSAEEIIKQADAGQDDAVRALDLYIDRLARALAAVINILDPDVIVLGGGLSKVECLYDRVPGLWPALVFGDEVATRLVPPVHGDSSGVRGAAWLWPPTDVDT